MSGGIALGLPEARRNEGGRRCSAAVAFPTAGSRPGIFRPAGRPGRSGFGAGSADWQVGELPAGVELFDLSEANPPPLGARPIWAR